jgi:hypothetical protein
MIICNSTEIIYVYTENAGVAWLYKYFALIGILTVVVNE